MVRLSLGLGASALLVALIVGLLLFWRFLFTTLRRGFAHVLVVATECDRRSGEHRFHDAVAAHRRESPAHERGLGEAVDRAEFAQGVDHQEVARARESGRGAPEIAAQHHSAADGAGSRERHEVDALVVDKLLRKRIAVERFRALRSKALPLAETAGYVTDDDVFRDI